MSSIWTPSGEHSPVPPPEPVESAPRVAPEGEASAEELAALRQLHEQVRSTPAVDIIANHVVQLFELALVYLGVATPPDATGRVPVPDLAQAGLVIDTMTTVVDGLGPRLDEHEQTLRDGLSQIQMLYVQVADELDRRAT